MEAAERETVVSYDDGGQLVHIYTCRRPDITQIRKKPEFTIVSEGFYPDGTPFVTATIPLERFSLVRAVKGTRSLTPEQRQALADRLKKNLDL